MFLLAENKSSMKNSFMRTVSEFPETPRFLVLRDRVWLSCVSMLLPCETHGYGKGCDTGPVDQSENIVLFGRRGFIQTGTKQGFFSQKHRKFISRS